MPCARVRGEGVNFAIVRRYATGVRLDPFARAGCEVYFTLVTVAAVVGGITHPQLAGGEAPVDLLLRSHIWAEAHKGWPGLDGVSGFCVDDARAYLPSSARFNASTFTRGSPRNPNCRPSVCCSTSR